MSLTAVSANADVPNPLPSEAAPSNGLTGMPCRVISVWYEPGPTSAVVEPSMRSFASRSTLLLKAESPPTVRERGDFGSYAPTPGTSCPIGFESSFFVFDANDAVWLPPAAAPSKVFTGVPSVRILCESYAPAPGVSSVFSHLPVTRFAETPKPPEPWLAILLNDLPAPLIDGMFGLTGS